MSSISVPGTWVVSSVYRQLQKRRRVSEPTIIEFIRRFVRTSTRSCRFRCTLRRDWHSRLDIRFIELVFSATSGPTEQLDRALLTTLVSVFMIKLFVGLN